uniref:TH1 domain-containing protein n=1 Tax=Knipowitschia caucasica TaxID=637954 RepID=A0AAV2K5S7_KNICA
MVSSAISAGAAVLMEMADPGRPYLCGQTGCVGFARFHPNLVVGGTYSGQIVLWDNRSHRRNPVQRTPLSAAAPTVNRFNKNSDRALLITDKHIYKLEPRKQFKTLKRTSLDVVTGVSVSSGCDQLVVLHSSTQDDTLLCLQGGLLNPHQDRVGELVGALLHHFTRRFVGAALTHPGNIRSRKGHPNIQ